MSLYSPMTGEIAAKSVVNVGVIGAGGKHAGWSHLAPLAQVEGCNLQILADIRPFEEVPYGAQETTEHWQDVVRHPEVDAVFAITPDYQHTKQLLAAVGNRKHAFIEKPLANSWVDFNILKSALDIADDRDLVVSTCHPRRFDPPFVNTKKLLDEPEALAALFEVPDSQEFGPVNSLTIDLNYSRPSKTGLHTSFASDHIPHEMDTASHFFGFSGLAYAVSYVNKELEFDIAAQREDGIALRFRGNRLQEGKGYLEDWQVGFASGTVLSVDAHTGRVALTNNGKAVGKRAEIVDEARFTTAYDQRFYDLNNHVIQSIRRPNEVVPYLTRQDMLMNTVVALALQEVNRPVAIAGDGSVSPL